jgi:hypothetical protein
MKKNLFVILSLILFLNFYFIKSPVSYAQNDNQCVFDAKFKELENILKNPDPDSLKQYNQELSLRKELLSDVLNCLIVNNSNLKDNLNQLNITNSFTRDIKNKIIKKLDEAQEYYEFRKNRVNGLSIEGLKYTSYSLKTDRESRFIPIENIAEDFILWNKNNELFSFAQKRYDEMNKSIQIFKPEENESIKSALDDAQKKLNDALEKHNLALNAISDFNHNEAKDFINQSLEGLLGVYKIFYDLSQKAMSLMKINK